MRWATLGHCVQPTGAVLLCPRKKGSAGRHRAEKGAGPRRGAKAPLRPRLSELDGVGDQLEVCLLVCWGRGGGLSFSAPRM